MNIMYYLFTPYYTHANANDDNTLNHKDEIEWLVSWSWMLLNIDRSVWDNLRSSIYQHTSTTGKSLLLHTKQKKNCPETTTQSSWMRSRATYGKQAST